MYHTQNLHAQVYVVGDVGIQEELDLHGYQHFGGPEDAGKVIELKAGYALPHDENVRSLLLAVFLQSVLSHMQSAAASCEAPVPTCSEHCATGNFK